MKYKHVRRECNKPMRRPQCQAGARAPKLLTLECRTAISEIELCLNVLLLKGGGQIEKHSWPIELSAGSVDGLFRRTIIS